MKRIFNCSSAFIAMAVLSFLSLISCKKDSEVIKTENFAVQPTMNSIANTNAPLKLTGMAAPLFIEDANMQFPVGDATLLYENATHQPLLAPDGHQVTLGEFNKAGGTAEIKCVNNGTHIVLHLTGLIPKGIYTIWIVTFKSPGFEPTFANQIGEGALGAPDGSQNQFNVSASGTGSISAIMPAGALSEFGSIGSCLSSDYEIHIVTAYHLDNLTHGITPGPPGTFIVHSDFAFIGTQL